MQDYCIAMLQIIKSRKLGDLFTIQPFRLAAVVWLAILLTSCLPLSADQTELILPTRTQSAISTPTKPIQWFPATSTPTSFPRVNPTTAPIARSGIGLLISEDEFTDPANWSGISTESDSLNKVIWNDNALYFAVNQAPINLYSLNQNLLVTNFYAEVTFSINRCSPNDAYGLSFFALNERYGNRFVLRCDGNVRVVQVRDQLTLPLQGWVLSGMAPPGAPGIVKVSVWSYNGEIRFFLNDQIQFSLTDTYYKSGGIGFFVESKDPAGMNIKIYDLKVYELQAQPPTPVPSP